MPIQIGVALLCLVLLREFEAEDEAWGLEAGPSLNGLDFTATSNGTTPEPIDKGKAIGVLKRKEIGCPLVSMEQYQGSLNAETASIMSTSLTVRIENDSIKDEERELGRPIHPGSMDAESDSGYSRCHHFCSSVPLGV